MAKLDKIIDYELTALYPEKPIYSIKHLCSILSVTEDYLNKIIKKINSFHKLNHNILPRRTYIIVSPLKEIHDKIKNKILARVVHPSYLFVRLKGRIISQNTSLHIKY